MKGRPTDRDASAFAPELAARLAALLRQIDPEADAERGVLEVAKLLSEASTPPLEDGLLSVVVRNHTTKRADLLDEALFSLACSDHRPLEIVLASQAPEMDARRQLEELLARHTALAEGVTARLVHAPSRHDERGKLANAGIAAARGRYLAFLDDDDVVYPSHHASLVRALQDGDRAWAVGRARKVAITRTTDGWYVRSKSRWGAGDAFDLARLARDNHVPVHAYVVDRARVRGLRVMFAEDLPAQEDYAFLLRLSGLFRPTIVDGPPGCEYRFRDDGTNATPHADAPVAAQVAGARRWSRSESAVARARAEAVALLSMDEVAALSPESVTAPAGAPAPLRHRLADRLNAAVKRLPGVHAFLKATLGKDRR